MTHLQDTWGNSMMVLEGSTPEEAPGWQCRCKSLSPQDWPHWNPEQQLVSCMQDTLHDCTAYMIHSLVTVIPLLQLKFKAVSYALDLVCAPSAMHIIRNGLYSQTYWSKLERAPCRSFIDVGCVCLFCTFSVLTILLQVMETFAPVIMSTVCCRKLEYLYWSIVYVHM